MLVVGICLCSYILLTWIQAVCTGESSKIKVHANVKNAKPKKVSPWENKKYRGSPLYLLDSKICKELDSEFYQKENTSFRLLSKHCTSPNELPTDENREKMIRDIIIPILKDQDLEQSLQGSIDHYLES